jgi:hypothetical protein
MLPQSEGQPGSGVESTYLLQKTIASGELGYLKKAHRNDKALVHPFKNKKR